jgi:hypothetical protein
MTQEKVAAVNKLLLDGEPGNITKADTNGYVGYEPQAIIDAMNEGFGIGNWGFDEVSSETVDNEKGTLAIAHISVWLKDIEFKPTSWGQSRVTRGDIGDAKKGAQTDAIKKGLAYFSIGNRAYHGLLDGKKQAPQPARPVQQPTPLQPTSEITAPITGKLRKMFQSIGTTLETAQKMKFGVIKPDDNLSPEECYVLHQVYDAWKIKYDEKKAS